MVQGAGAKCLKFLMIAFNVLFLLAGLALIVIGAIAQAQASKAGIASSAAILVLVVGGVIFILAFMGCCGAMKENRCLLITFGVLMIVVFVICIAAIILAVVFRSKMAELIKEPLLDSIKNYKEGNSVWDWRNIQLEEECCGVNNSLDWKRNPSYENSLPPSCCGKKTNATCSYSDTKVYKTGCLEKIANNMKEPVLVLGGFVAAVAILEILAIVFSLCLAHAIHQGYNVV